MPKFVINQEYIPVSAYFIENLLKDANGLYVKVYLFALSLAVKGAEVDTAFIARELDILESEVIHAFTYWKETGIIIEDSGIVEFCDKPISITHDIPAPAQPVNNSEIEKKNYDSIELANKISQDQSLSELVMLSQELLAKPLTQNELETIYWFYDELGYSSEAILLILDYCISKNKRSFKYIEKVAVSWHSQGIISAEQLVCHIAEEEKKALYTNNLRKGMGIADRALSKQEEEYLNKWYNAYKTPEDMILLAYEYCLINTAKLSFPYMDKIVERWHQQGITTRQAAEEENKQHKKKNGAFKSDKDGLGHTGLEKLTQAF